MRDELSRMLIELPLEAALIWRRRMASIWTELRPSQWVKNSAVLAPLIFSLNLFHFDSLLAALMVFGSFCMVSSSVYLLNDIQDRDEDRLHPTKRHRPIASGDIPVKTGVVLLALLLLGGLSLAFSLSRGVGLLLLGYWSLNLLYSLWLKHQVILDVFSIAAGFMLRVTAGAVGIQVEMSHWLILCTVLLALFLGFGKRRYELVLLGEDAVSHRQVLSDYSIQFLDMMIGIVTACTLMSYALYTVSEATVSRFQTTGLLWTLPFVLYGIFRYLYLVYHRNEGGNPTQQLLTDPQILINIGLWVLTVGFVVYR